jgi:HK97 family phage major capsid protein
MNKRKKMMDMLARKEARKNELLERTKTSTSVDELRSINAEMEALTKDIADIRATIVVIDTGDDDGDGTCPGCGEEVDDDDAFCANCGSPLDAQRSAKPPKKSEKRKRGVTDPAPAPVVEGRGAAPVPQGGFNPLGTYGVGAAPLHTEARDMATMEYAEVLAAPEYRIAYLKRLQNKTLNEVEKRALTIAAEKRDITTAPGSAGAAVPTTTYDKIIMKLRQSSVLFPWISTTYIPGNVILPVANALTAAVWSAEAVVGVNGDDTVLPVSLGGYTLAKYAKLSIAVETMTIEAFEAYIVNQIGLQLAIAIENVILNGLGASPAAPNLPQPTGILSGIGFTFDATNSLTYSLANGLGYDDFVDCQALLRSMYRLGAQWVMNIQTEAQLMKIKSSTGIPLFTQDPQNGFQKKVLNYPYLVDDYIPNNTILFCRPDYYYMNFSQSPEIEADRSAAFTSASIMYRGLLIADGKPALSEAFVLMTGA